MSDIIAQPLTSDTKFLIKNQAQSIELQKILISLGKAWTSKYPGGILLGGDSSYTHVGIFVRGEGRGSLSQTSDIEYFHEHPAIELDTDEFIRQHTEGTAEEIFPQTGLNVDQLFEIYSKHHSIADVANEAIKQYILNRRIGGS